MERTEMLIKRLTGVVTLLVLLPLALQAGPLEEAQAALKAGKPGEVDAKLGQLLERRPVPNEVLLLSFEAAMAAGRPYTAERRINALLEKGGGLPPNIAFQAAEVAGQLNKNSLRRERLHYFLRHENGWNEQVERALLYLCRDGGDADLFARYIASVPASEANFELGLQMLQQMREAKQVPEYVKQLNSLFAKFSAAPHRIRLLEDVGAMANNNITGLQGELIEVLGRYPQLDQALYVGLMSRFNEWNAPLLVDFCQRHKQLVPLYIFQRISNLDSIKDEALRRATGQKLLQLEPLCSAAAEPDYLKVLYEAIVRAPETFAVGQLLKPGYMAPLYGKLVQGYWTRLDEIRHLAAESITRKVWSDDETAKLKETFAQAFDARSLVWPDLAEQARKTKDLGPTRALFAKTPGRLDIRWLAVGYISELGDGGLVKEIVSEHVLTYPINFEADNVARHLLGCEALSAGERVKTLQTLFARTGYTPAWQRLIDWPHNPLKENEIFLQFAKSVVPEAKGSDPLIAACVALHALKPGPQNAVPAEVHTLAAQGIAAFKGTWPDPKEPQASAVFGSLRDRYSELVQGSRPDCGEFVRLMAPKLGSKAPLNSWNSLRHFANHSQNNTNVLIAITAFVKALPERADDVRDTWIDKGNTTTPLTEYYGRMTPDNAAHHVLGNCDRWPMQIQAREIAALFKAQPPETMSPGNLDRALRTMQLLAPTNSFAAQFPLDLLADAIFGQRAGTFNTRRQLLGVYANAGKLDEGLQRYLAAARKSDPATRAGDIIKLLGAQAQIQGWLINQEEDGEEPGKYECGALLRDELNPALKAVPYKQSALVRPFSTWLVLDRTVNMLRRTKQSDDLKSVANETARLIALHVAHGMPWGTENYRIHIIAREALAGAIENGARADAAALARLVGTSYQHNVDPNGTVLLQLLEKARTAGYWEPIHIITSSVTAEGNLASSLTRLRAEAGTHMPGIYPVPENDPTYPLYVAADELERNNPEQAWTLLRKAMGPFEREALKLPPDFVIWGVEQLRRARGANDSLLLRARSIADQLLARESSLTPELAAAMMLTRAECFRDQRNYEAARLEYQTLRNNNSYRKTRAARHAMFRDVDLMIEIGNASAAEAVIEYWMSQADVEIQAQAHYFQARIAFDRKEYEEARKQLENVFMLDFTHTEARLLHGAWKLATNYEVDDTAVLVGDLSDRTLIRPGQQLTITVQDRNLGVAGGGSSIPVLVTTSKGRDAETIALYPSTRDPFLFRGVIDTRLGLATPTNRVLELRGDETVSYVVDPEFLRLRGLARTPPKELRVVDDARLAIGAGAPQAEDGRPEAELEQLLVNTSESDSRLRGASDLASSLRPGNPIYVVVRDRDRSISPDTPNAVHVTARTTSGDALESIRLEETEPFSGVFRGTIPTALPPPRAAASDTAVGFNVGDTINSTRQGLWRSVPDSAAGKWIEVDTMGSHSVSNVALMMPEPDSVRAIRLTGRLADETVVLGSLPVGDLSQRYGLRIQQATGRKLNQEAAIRSLFAGNQAPAAKAITNLLFTSIQPKRDVTQNALISGAFALPEGETLLRLRLEALNTKGRTLAGLWMAIAIDGVTVFSGQGNSLHRRPILLDVTPGPHRLELFVSAEFPEDAFELRYEPEGNRAAPLPLAWFDPTQVPALVDFLKDRAEIKRDKNGFTASFAVPERLRSLRWEFVDYTGRELSVSKLYVQDAAGKLVIPVESDYSDALHNETLEVAPGDQIFVTYTDDITSSGERRVLQRTLRSSFNDAEVKFCFEDIRETRYGREIYLHQAYRFIPGDTLVVSVLDPDADLTPEADRIKVKITTRSGQSRTLELLEQRRRFDMHGREYFINDTDGIHGGQFLGLLRTVAADTADPPANALPIAPGDVITMAYYDRENTRPGVPIERLAHVQAAQASQPLLTLYHARIEREEDTSQDAKLRLEQIRRRPGNENVKVLYRDQPVAVAMSEDEMRASISNPVPVNVAVPIPVQISDPARARHAASLLYLEVAAGSELQAADAEGREPEVVQMPLSLSPGFPGFRSAIATRGLRESGSSGNFFGLIRLRLGPPDPTRDLDDDAPPELSVNGADTIRMRLLDDDGSIQLERTLKLVSNARLSLMDSTYSAERLAAHVGERFFIRVEDADRDSGPEHDEIEVEVTAMAQGHTRRLTLRETLPHSGIFSGTLRPVIFGPDEQIPAVATGGVAAAGAELDDRLAVRYGDKVRFRYFDQVTLPGTEPGPIEVIGQVHKGSDGSVRLFSKRFRDSDMAVLVQFRLAECLFETAKEHRRLKQPERSAEAIEQGKFILEEALRNYPDTAHIVEGEYLLANLYQELAMEQKEADDLQAAAPLFTEALARFSAILSTWPDSVFGARAQYHKALCLEMLGDYNRASEEYVKMTYLFPESPLVGDASIRLATYYYQQEQRYDTAGRIYASFQRRFPTHEKADRALFMSAQCHMKEAERLQHDFRQAGNKGPNPATLIIEEYEAAVAALNTLVETYRETASPALRAQSLYWAGDASLRAKNYESAYLYLKRTVFEYPETEWARRARGLLLQESSIFEKLE